MEGIVIGKVRARDGQEVNVVHVLGMLGYKFDAVGTKSLPFAVELAVAQTQGKLDLTGMLGEKGNVIISQRGHKR